MKEAIVVPRSSRAAVLSLFRGVYTKVARETKREVSYIRRVALGEMKSREVERELAAELRRVAALIQNGQV